MDIVHRDLKPSNILFDKQGHAKVADLGLAQLPGGYSQRSQLSTPDPHPGTPAYMSPEQENGRSYLTPASDVYALGLVLFEALTGRVYRSQRQGTLVGSLRSDVPGWLDELLVRMLAQNPLERPWDGKEMETLLLQGMKGEEAGRKQNLAQHVAKIRLPKVLRVRSQHLAEQKVRQEAEERLRLEPVAQVQREAESSSVLKSKPASEPVPISKYEPFPIQDKDTELLSSAQKALKEDSLDESMKQYTKLIRKGNLLGEVIHDLREATHHYPANVNIWQTLGDAYMRANRLQDSLDAYTVVERLIR
jgi:serine/threonine protein kinase